MRKLLVLFVSISILVLGCSKDKDDDPLKGLVKFSSGPDYDNGAIVFTAEIQFAAVGKAENIEYQILEGNDVLLDESLETQNADGGLGLFFQSGEVTITLNPLSDFSGKELTVWLDPENKVTSDEYTDDTDVNLWKKKTVSIP
jgi:hypothetical protein